MRFFPVCMCLFVCAKIFSLNACLLYVQEVLAFWHSTLTISKWTRLLGHRVKVFRMMHTFCIACISFLVYIMLTLECISIYFLKFLNLTAKHRTQPINSNVLYEKGWGVDSKFAKTILECFLYMPKMWIMCQRYLNT